MQDARTPEAATYVSYTGRSKHAGKHLELNKEAFDGGTDMNKVFESDVGAMRSMVPFMHESAMAMWGEFVSAVTTVDMTSRSEYPLIDTSLALSAAKNTEPMTNKSDPTPKARGSVMLLLRTLELRSVMELLPDTSSPLAA